MTTTSPGPRPTPNDDLATLAAEHGLIAGGARQPLGEYLRELWARRDFASALASGSKNAQFRDTVLGRMWQVLSPILNAMVYYFIFGVLLQTSKGVENFPAFLIIGVFTFTYTQRAVTGGTKAIANNRNIIRAIHFPRAVMPLSVIVQEVQQQVVSMGVLVVIVLLTGEPITWLWLGVIPAVLLQTIFNVGLCMLVARWTAASRDVAQLVPFVMQTWRYLSGVMFAIPVFTADLDPWVEKALYLNPMTQYIEMMRGCLLSGYETPAHLWAFAAGWAVVTLVVGFLVFYRAEETYSRG